LWTIQDTLLRWQVAKYKEENMSLTLSIDQLLALVDGDRWPFDVDQFDALDRTVALEADRLDLTARMPRLNLRTECRGCTNLPVGPGTNHDPPGYFYPMPSQIPEWRRQMLTLRAFAETAEQRMRAKNGGKPPVSGNRERADVPEMKNGAQPEELPSHTARDNQPPISLLFSWREILEALKLDASQQKRLRALNKRYGGPIILPGKGGQPTADKDKLLAWWNQLEVQMRDRQQRRADEQGSVKDQHPYGRQGTEVPGIHGHVRQRKKKPSS
jgi:hypothetical protein